MAFCSFSKKPCPIGAANRQMKNPSTFLLLWTTPCSPDRAGSYESLGGGGRRDPSPPSSPLSSSCTCASPGPGIPGAAMATDCDVSNLRPGTRTTSGCELIEGWLHHLGGGWTQLGGPAAGPRVSGLQPLRGVFSFTPFKPGSTGLRCPPTPQRTDASRGSPGWVSILVILFCFLKIPPAGLPGEDVLLLGSFFQKRSVGWSVGTDWRPQTWPCVPEGEQQAAGGSWRPALAGPPGGLSVIFKIVFDSILGPEEGL